MTIAHRTGSPYATYGSSQAGVNVVTGDFILVMVATAAQSDPGPPSDTDTNSYSQVAYYSEGSLSQACIIMWYAYAKSTNASLTISCPSGSDPAIHVFVLTGVATSSVLDNHLTYIDTVPGTAHQTGNLTLTSSGLMVAFWAQRVHGSTDSGADSWSLDKQLANISDSLEKAYSSSPQTASMTSTTAVASYICIFAGFKAAATGLTVNGVLASAVDVVSSYSAVDGVHV